MHLVFPRSGSQLRQPLLAYDASSALLWVALGVAQSPIRSLGLRSTCGRLPSWRLLRVRCPVFCVDVSS